MREDQKPELIARGLWYVDTRYPRGVAWSGIRGRPEEDVLDFSTVDR